MGRILAALYLRLSKEDEEKEQDSQSIQNQQAFLLDYCMKQQFTVVDIYIDDGYSGLNFNRPGFLRLLDDIEQKKVNLVLTKDLSRLGRDYILTGHYLERYFPEHGVRFIAVNDHIDTATGQSDLTPFRAVYNDIYARDISRKVCTALEVKGKQGKFIGTFPPYGYRKDPADKNHLLIDPQQAVYVQRIFALFLSGKPIGGVAAQLTAEGVPTPAQTRSVQAMDEKKSWSYAAVRRILTAPVYQGDMVSHTAQKVNYKLQKRVHLPKEAWYVVEGTHEGIVSRETFARAQTLLRVRSYAGRVPSQAPQPKPLTGLIFCADCRAPMVLWSNGKCRYFVCSGWKKSRAPKTCTAHYLREEAVIEVVQRALRERFAKAEAEQVLMLAKAGPDDSAANLLKEIEKKECALENTLLCLYKDRAAGIVNSETYQFLSQRLHNEADDLKKKREALAQFTVEEQEQALLRRLKSLFDMESLSREIAICLIERIEVNADKSLTIFLRCTG